MAQWAKDPTAAALVAAEVWLDPRPSALGLKEPVLPHLRRKSQLWLRFSSWPGNFHVLLVRPFKKNKSKQTHVHHCLPNTVHPPVQAQGDPLAPGLDDKEPSLFPPPSL